MAATVVIKNLTKDYGAYRALDDASLSFGEGVTGLLGPNGAGKSTLIKAMLGLVRVASGEGTVYGHDIRRESRAIRELVGYMPEDDCYLAGLNGVQMVRFAARLAGMDGTESLRRTHEMLDFVGIREERYREVQTYSTGMRQKLQFAQAIVHDPRLLILDEPTAGLDPDERRKMLDRVKALGTLAGKTVLISTHILHDVQAVCDHVIILARGKVKLTESLAVLDRPAEVAFTIRVHGDPTPLATRIGQGGGQVERDGATLVVRGVGPDFPAQAWTWAEELGVAIRGLEPARHSLEQLFLDTVREDAGAHV